MKKKEEAIKLSIAIREIKNTAQNYEKEFEEKLIQIKKIFFSFEKFTSSLESLSDKTKVEDDSFNIKFKEKGRNLDNTHDTDKHRSS